jgi:hypothetical protein
MIIRDLKLQYSRNSHMYYVLLHPCIKVLFDFIHSKIQKLIVNCRIINIFWPFVLIVLVITMHLQVLGFIHSCHVLMYFLITMDL